MTNWYFKIWIIVSVLTLIGTLILPTFSIESFQLFVTKHQTQFDKIESHKTNFFLTQIDNFTTAYPKVKIHSDYGHGIDSLISQALKTVETTNVNTIENHISDHLLTEYIGKYFDNFRIKKSNEDFEKVRINRWVSIFYKQTHFQYLRYHSLLEFYRHSKTNHYVDYSESLLFRNHFNFKTNENYTIKFGLYNRRQLKNLQISVNDEPQKVIDYKVDWKYKPQQFGWNKIKISYQGKFKNQFISDSTFYHFYVCE